MMGENLPNENDMDRFFQGFTDATIACQNMVVGILKRENKNRSGFSNLVREQDFDFR